MNLTIHTTSPLVINIHDRRRSTSRNTLSLAAIGDAPPPAAVAAAPAAEPTTAPQPTLEWSPTSPDTMPHAKAEQWCKDLRHGGHDDWRLPTREELQSLVDYSRHNPAIDTERFPDTQSGYYWTSSPAASAPSYAWLVYFNYGNVGLYHRDPNAWVRAVRVSRASQ